MGPCAKGKLASRRSNLCFRPPPPPPPEPPLANPPPPPPPLLTHAGVGGWRGGWGSSHRSAPTGSDRLLFFLLTLCRRVSPLMWVRRGWVSPSPTSFPAPPPRPSEGCDFCGRPCQISVPSSPDQCQRRASGERLTSSRQAATRHPDGRPPGCHPPRTSLTAARSPTRPAARHHQWKNMFLQTAS